MDLCLELATQIIVRLNEPFAQPMKSTALATSANVTSSAWGARTPATVVGPAGHAEGEVAPR